MSLFCSTSHILSILIPISLPLSLSLSFRIAFVTPFLSWIPSISSLTSGNLSLPLPSQPTWSFSLFLIWSFSLSLSLSLSSNPEAFTNQKQISYKETNFISPRKKKNRFCFFSAQQAKWRFSRDCVFEIHIIKSFSLITSC